MGLSNLRAGVIIRVTGQESRVLGSPDGTAWQFENTKTRMISKMTTSEVLERLENGTVAFVANNRCQGRDAVKGVLSDSELETAKTRLAYIRPLLKGSISERQVREVIEEVSEALQRPSSRPSLSSVRRWTRLYLQAGSDMRALVDQTHKKGNRTPRYPEEVVREVDEAIALKCLQRTRGTLDSALSEARLRVQRLNDERPTSMQLALPTRRLLKRRFEVIPAFDRYAARNGQEAARKYFRSVKGHRIANRPLERAEIDHTPLDVLVIDAYGSPLGRPYLTLAIDVFTRCVLGFYIGFTPPSYLSVAKCLKQAILPKYTLLSAYQDVKNEWPCFGVMTELSVDNGLEFHSGGLEQACGSIGAEIHYSPRKEPWAKGKIERFLGTLNRAVCHSIPGATFANIMEKGDYDAAKNATLTLPDLQSIVLKWIVDVYHQTPHRALGTSPVAMWKREIVLEDIFLPDESVNFDVVMGRPHSRKLTHKGIEFESLLYNSHELQDLRKARGTTLDVEIRVDEDDLSEIYVIFEKTIAPYKVPALHTAYAQGLSLWQHKIHKNYLARVGASEFDERSLLEAKREIADRVDAARGSRKLRSGKRLGRYSDPNGDNARLGEAPTPVGASSSARKAAHELSVKPEKLANPTFNIGNPMNNNFPRFKAERKKGL